MLAGSPVTYFCSLEKKIETLEKQVEILGNSNKFLSNRIDDNYKDIKYLQEQMEILQDKEEDETIEKMFNIEINYGVFGNINHNIESNNELEIFIKCHLRHNPYVKNIKITPIESCTKFN